MRAMTIYHMIFWLCVVERARGSAIKLGKQWSVDVLSIKGSKALSG